MQKVGLFIEDRGNSPPIRHQFAKFLHFSFFAHLSFHLTMIKCEGIIGSQDLLLGEFFFVLGTAKDIAIIYSELTFNPLSFERCLYFLAFFLSKKKKTKILKRFGVTFAVNVKRRIQFNLTITRKLRKKKTPIKKKRCPK